jgi:arginine kinase
VEVSIFTWDPAFQIESKRDEFRKYLETSGATEKLTMALMKLYQEEERPTDAMAFIRKQLCGDDLPDPEEINAMRDEIKLLKMQKEKIEQEKVVSEEEVKKTDSEVENALTKKFKAFEADDTGNSLLKEHLTEEIFESLMEEKTEEFEGSLLDNIQCGFTHYDAEVGIFASDQNAYETFADLFKPVLEELHETEVVTGEGDDAVTTSAKQPELEWGEVEEVKDLDPEGSVVKSISVTIGRAIDMVPFAPIISAEQLQENAEKLKKILTAIEDEELKGKYHEFVEIDEEQRKKWIEEEILFSEPQDKFLEAAGTYRLWPVGRGLFLNDKNNLRVWVNEEEHLQVTTFDIGGNLREVYQRLVKVMELFVDLKFARDERWGFLAHNLKNIGTTMRVSVKTNLPELSKEENKEKLENVCEENQLKLKNLGEGNVQLTNKKRMGITEFDTVKAFEKAIEEVINAEKCASTS